MSKSSRQARAKAKIARKVVNLSLPAALIDKVKASAVANGRTFSGEVAERLAVSVREEAA